MQNASFLSAFPGDPAVITALVSILLLSVGSVNGADHGYTDPNDYLLAIERLGERKPFLTDSPDVYLEKRSLNHFFTERIYRRLEGNPYFGYAYDEGFRFEGSAVHLILRDVTPGEMCHEAYEFALENALADAGLEIKSGAACQVGVCIVGMEAEEKPGTLPGVMVEAFLRNSRLKKSFFIRYGAGSPRSLAAAILISAEMLVGLLEARR